MADKEEADPTSESTPAATDPTLDGGTVVPHADGVAANGPDPAGTAGERSGSHAFDPAASDPHVEPDPGEPELSDEELAEEDFAADEPISVDELGERDGELVAVGAPAKKRSADGDKQATSKALARAKKAKATPKQRVEVAKDKRTGPVTFVKESADELRKVVYPTGQQLINYFIVVLIFVLFIIAIVSLLDLAFGAAILKLFS